MIGEGVFWHLHFSIHPISWDFRHLLLSQIVWLLSPKHLLLYRFYVLNEHLSTEKSLHFSVLEAIGLVIKLNLPFYMFNQPKLCEEVKTVQDIFILCVNYMNGFLNFFSVSFHFVLLWLLRTLRIKN